MIIYLIEFDSLVEVNHPKLKIGRTYDLIVSGINFGQVYVVGAL